MHAGGAVRVPVAAGGAQGGGEASGERTRARAWARVHAGVGAPSQRGGEPGCLGAVCLSRLDRRPNSWVTLMCAWRAVGAGGRRRNACAVPITPVPAASSASITPAAGRTCPSACGGTAGCSTSRGAAAAGTCSSEPSRPPRSRPDAPSTGPWRARIVLHGGAAERDNRHRARAVLPILSLLPLSVLYC